VLREFALRIRKSIRGIDLACRYGGEEFVVVMPETDVGVATMVEERLRRRIASEPFAIQQGARAVQVTISIGIAGVTDGESAASAIKRADQALCRAKRPTTDRALTNPHFTGTSARPRFPAIALGSGREAIPGWGPPWPGPG
jgi:two-component system, cell cycle response regulator